MKDGHLNGFPLEDIDENAAATGEQGCFSRVKRGLSVHGNRGSHSHGVGIASTIARGRQHAYSMNGGPNTSMPRISDGTAGFQPGPRGFKNRTVTQSSGIHTNVPGTPGTFCRQTGAYAPQEPWNQGGPLTRDSFEQGWARLQHMRFDRSPAVPTTREEWMEHYDWMANFYAKEQESCAKTAAIDEQFKQKYNLKSVLCFNGKALGDGRSGVLGEKTIWTMHWAPESGHELCPWPTAAEYKEEGDERHTSGFGRFLPVPRVAGNPTVTYKQKSYQEPYRMDYVHPVPKLYDVIFKGDYQTHEVSRDGAGNPIDDYSAAGNELKVACSYTDDEFSSFTGTTALCTRIRSGVDNLVHPTKQATVLNPEAKSFNPPCGASAANHSPSSASATTSAGAPHMAIICPPELEEVYSASATRGLSMANSIGFSAADLQPRDAAPRTSPPAPTNMMARMTLGEALAMDNKMGLAEALELTEE